MTNVFHESPDRQTVNLPSEGATEYVGETPFIESNLVLSYQSDDLDQALYWLKKMSPEERKRFQHVLQELRQFMYANTKWSER